MNTLIMLFGLTMLYLTSTGRLEASIRMLCAQGLLLFLMVAAGYKEMGWSEMLIFTSETLVMKACIIPWFLVKVVRRNRIQRDIEASIPRFNTLAIDSAILGFGFLIAFWVHKSAEGVQPLSFGISVSTMISSLFLILTRSKIISHVIGYLCLENGIFLLSLSVAQRMPAIVSLGVLLDLFLAVFLFGIVFTRIRSSFEEIDADALTILKDRP